ncbi:putative ATPase [Tamaricihabitans halophyticus]|uniref:Putative ATPase n=1 Tax=Tamaricihabitans halophyticus TaxID=1262583 RepID=A0A4R2QUQ3_9PSEU|nr:BTAD domain-containing putative transcriptional regulator [Tamaricihabitans halophyticus]TCP50815.1 putative ATPase [Tamaricihabitans halophyticus]
MRFGVLGPLAVWNADGTEVAVPGRKVRALLANLLVLDGKPVSADRLMEHLWGADQPGNPAGALQAKVSQLRRVLDEVEPGGRQLLTAGPSGYALRLDQATVDANQFAELVRDARQQPDPGVRAKLLREALDLWRGAAYADFADEEFARSTIDRLEESRRAAWDDAVQARLELGQHAELIGELSDALVHDPLRERLRALHMHALYLAGRQADALHSFDQLREHLAEELGLDPGPEISELRQRILRQDPTLRLAEPAHDTTRHTPPRTNLPLPATEIIGRQAELSSIVATLHPGRLVTLLGPGGVGKTRLALEVAHQYQEAPDGVWFLELGALSEHDCTDPVSALAEHIAAALNIREHQTLAMSMSTEPRSAAEQLTDALRDKRQLLVLDNCEHLVESVAALADRLRRAVPELSLLATSREPLGLHGEQLWPLAPLTLPAPDSGYTQSWSESGAIQLFVARAAARAPGFRLSEDNAATIAAICRRLDGLPLALELAAARVRALGIEQLAARLDDRFGILTTGNRDAPERQQTLRAVIDWSWELLSDPERTVLRRLAVHTDGCTLAAAEAICAGDGIDERDVLDILAQLVDRSLVQVLDQESRVRYRMLETVTSYCLERLAETGEQQAAELRHLRHYTALAETAEPRLRESSQQQWLCVLDTEAGNLRAALETANRLHRADLALRLARALAWYWFLRGRYRETHRTLARALDVPDSPGLDSTGPDSTGLDSTGPDSTGDGQLSLSRAMVTAWLAGIDMLRNAGTDPLGRSTTAIAHFDGLDAPVERAYAQWLLAFCMSQVGARDTVDTLLTDALDAMRAIGDQWGEAAALALRAWQSLSRGELTASRQDAEDSWTRFQEIGDRWGGVHVIQLLGVLAEIDGEYTRADQLNQMGLRFAEELGLWPMVAESLGRLGRLALLAKDFARADELHDRALHVALDQSFKPGAVFAEMGLVMAARRQGDFPKAETHIQRPLDWHRNQGYEAGLAFVLAEHGFLTEQQGNPALAREIHQQGLETARLTGDPRSIALAIEGLAGVAALDGEAHQAALLLGVASAARESVRAPLPAAERGDVDRIRAVAVEQHGEAEFAEHFERGATLGLARYLAHHDAQDPAPRGER